MTPMDNAWILLKEPKRYDFDWSPFFEDPTDPYGYIPHERRPEARDAFHTYLRESYAQTPPPKWSRDWSTLEDEELQQLGNEDFDEYEEWDQYRNHLEYEQKRQEREQEWNDLLAEANQLGIGVSEWELKQKDSENLKTRIDKVSRYHQMARSHKSEPMDIAWRLLKGQLVHPSAMGYFARGRMVREEDDNPPEYSFDDQGDPANMRTSADKRRFDMQERIAQSLGHDRFVDMVQSDRDKRLDRMAQIPQEDVEAFIDRLNNPVMVTPQDGRPYMSPEDELRQRAMRNSLVDNPRL